MITPVNPGDRVYWRDDNRVEHIGRVIEWRDAHFTDEVEWEPWGEVMVERESDKALFHVHWEDLQRTCGRDRPMDSPGFANAMMRLA